MGQHWYNTEGDCFNVGLKDARKQGLFPSVTTVLKDLHNEGLEIYKVQQAIMASLTLPKITGESDSDYIKRILSDSKEHSIKAADKGKVIHNLIERYLRKEIIDEKEYKDYLPFCEPAFRWIDENIMSVKEIEFQFIDVRYGYAGTIDCICVDKDFKVCYIDWKTAGGELTAYPTYCYQLAAYAMGQDFKCINLLISTKEPKIKVKEWTAEEIETGKKIFLNLLANFKLIRKLK
jgi:hypothetical protein